MFPKPWLLVCLWAGCAARYTNNSMHDVLPFQCGLPTEPSERRHLGFTPESLVRRWDLPHRLVWDPLEPWARPLERVVDVDLSVALPDDAEPLFQRHHRSKFCHSGPLWRFPVEASLTSPELRFDHDPALVVAARRSDTRREVWPTATPGAEPVVILSDGLRSALEREVALASARTTVVLDRVDAAVGHFRPNFSDCGDTPGLRARACSGWVLWLGFDFVEDGVSVHRKVEARIVD